ncbi:MAG: Stp1/IreP family PP2C-type Ser/Thr phosphatase [Acidimicrobiales bacterium]
MTVLRSGAATDVGRVRRHNQDQLLTSDQLFAVADGMGGHAGGEVASAVAIAALNRAFTGESHTVDDLLDAMRHANEAVFERSLSDENLRGMGTTLTAAALVVVDGEERLAIANVGDSRTYVFAHNELTQLTEDHSIPEELVRQGQLDPAEVDAHPQRHILTRALGIQPEIDIDVWEVLPVVGDRIVLCSDGLVREVTDDQIASVLRRLAEPAEAASELVARARAQGGSDNITVIVVDVADDGGLVERASGAVDASSTVDTSAAAPPPAAEHDEVTGGAVTFPDASASEEAASAEERRRSRRRPITLRLVLFVLLVLVVIGGAIAAVVYYARGTYYVTFGPPGTASASPLADTTSRPILVFQGRPGGLLWFEPTLAERTDYISDEVCPAHLQDITHGHVVSSVRAANIYINNLLSEAQQTCAKP